MAVAKVDLKGRRWMITPGNIIERSALLQCPARKWMTQLNMVFLPMIPGNARVLKEQVEMGQLDLDPGSQHAAAFMNSIYEILKPANTERTWPKWYVFNNHKFPPADHQYEALQRVFPVDASALFMEMGTMKTRVIIDNMTAHFYEKRIRFVIVIVPLTVKMSTWVDELANFSACPYNFIDVDSDYNASSFRPLQDRIQWLVVGVESLSQGKTLKALLPLTRLGIPYGIVVDESTRIANHKAICTQAAFDLRERATIRMIATGFEVKKDLEDLYAQFQFLDPNIIGCGDFVSFRNRYCMMGGYKMKEIIGYNHIEELMGLIAPHVFQCDKSILKLPPKVPLKRMITISKEQRKVYDAVKRGELEEVSVANVLTKTLRLQQIANGYYNKDAWKIDPETGKKYKVPVEFVEVVKPSQNPKLQELIKIAKETGHPMIVWAESLYEIGIISAALGKMGEVLSIVGETPKEDRNGIVKRFQTGDIPYFVGTAAAGGIGVTLTAARTVVYFSNSQRLEYRVQSEDRAHRKGQTGSVAIVDLVAVATVDVGVLANHKEKIDLAMYVKAALRDRIAIGKFFDGEVDEDLIKRMQKGTYTIPAANDEMAKRARKPVQKVGA